jgi:hypothetical protein
MWQVIILYRAQNENEKSLSSIYDYKRIRPFLEGLVRKIASAIATGLTLGTSYIRTSIIRWDERFSVLKASP